MPAQYPVSNDSEFTLLEKIVNNTALLDELTATYVSSVNGRTGAVTLSKSDVGLTNVDNTSDLSKPISSATATALGGKAANGDIALSGLTTATATILGRATAATGAIEELSTSSAKTLLSLNNVENTALSTWAGSSNITTVGTVASGTWSGALISPTHGGTGVNNGTSTITIGGNVTVSGNYTLTVTVGAITSVTLPASGTLATLAGAESLTNKKLGSLTTNGIVTTSGSDGTLSVTATTGTGSVVLSGGPTFTGTAAFAAITTTGAVTVGDGTVDRAITIQGPATSGNGARVTFVRGGTTRGYIGTKGGIFGVDDGNIVIANAVLGGVVGIYTNASSTAAATFDASSNLVVGGYFKSAAPTGGTAGAWKLGVRVAATVALDTTQYVQLDVDGVLYKVGIVA